mmetsp:Transcript_28099/g.58823  ORF Transcript_28099/g.58823 Transcript_28099/m.58823 type:complete len:314 (-) Transcript_28099:754-1695(-)
MVLSTTAFQANGFLSSQCRQNVLSASLPPAMMFGAVPTSLPLQRVDQPCPCCLDCHQQQQGSAVAPSWRRSSCLYSRNPSGSNNELLNDDESDDVVDDEYLEKIRDADFLKTELERVESMEEILEELEDYYIENMGDVDDDDEDLLIGGDENLYPTDDGVVLWSEEKLQEILGNLPDDDELEVELLESIRTSDEQVASTSTSTPTSAPISSSAKQTTTESLSPPNESTSNDETELGNIAPSSSSSSPSSLANLERALLQGVVPVSANVGSDCLPGDFGFDPLSLATKDYFRQTQDFFCQFITRTATRQQQYGQ